MKCKKCGAHLKGGKLFCPVCGQEAQIVPEYSLLEEEILPELLVETEGSNPANEKVRSETVLPCASPITCRKSKKRILIIGIILSFVVTLAAFILWLVHLEQENSYRFQYEKGLTFFKERNYKKALNFFQKAGQLDEKQIPAQLMIADTYLALSDTKEAANILLKITKMDGSNQEAYQKLIAIYENSKDYEALAGLSTKVKKDKIAMLFAKFTAEKPRFSLTPGAYSQYIKIGILGRERDKIYFTMDGSAPQENGTLYQDMISLQREEEVLIRAVACNEYGFYSEELTGKYIVKLNKPAVPKVTPKSGTYYESFQIKIDVPSDTTVYYSWGNEEPTTESNKYTEPFSVPGEGEHILSLFLVDTFGMHSDIIKYSYRYLPEPPPESEDNEEGEIVQGNEIRRPDDYGLEVN